MSTIMTFSEFLTEAKEFIEFCKLIGEDEFKLVENSNEKEDSYVVCNKKISIIENDIEEKSDYGSICDDQINDNYDINDNNGNCMRTKIYNIEYHIVYHRSYQTPAIYFRGFKSDGCPIRIEDAWNIFRDPNQIYTNNIKLLFSIITQTDHPILFEPFFGLHPCQTSQVLDTAPQSRNRLVTFLSTMGPFIKLDISQKLSGFFS